MVLVIQFYIACIFRRLSEDGGSIFIKNSIHARWFGVCVEGHNFSAFWIEVCHGIVGGWGLVCNSSFGSLISHTTFYRSEDLF